jgi:hypothetical protein
MKPSLKLLVAAFAVAGSASVTPAMATTLSDLTATNTTDYFGSNISSTSFTDTYTFSLDVPASKPAILVSSSTINGLETVALSLYKGAVSPADLLLSGTYTNGRIDLGNLLASNADLATGLYTLLVSATSKGSGAYSGTVSISPVPLPAAIVLFGSGLIGLGAFGRRRAANRIA